MFKQSGSQNNKAPPTIQFDATRYDDLLQDENMTPDQREEFLRTIWDTLVAFIDLGFEVDLPSDSCGQNTDERGASTASDPRMVSSTEPGLAEAFPAIPTASNAVGKEEVPS